MEVTATSLLAVASPVLTVGRAVPQAVRLLRSGASGVSVATWILILIVAELWCAYGVLAHVPAELGANVPNGLLALLIAVLVGHRRATTGRVLVGASLLTAAAAALIAMSVHYGVSGLVGDVAVGGSVALYLPQLAKILRERDISGVSLTTWVLALLSAISWGAYGILIHKLPVFLPNVVIGPSSLVIVLRVALHPKQSGRRTSTSTDDRYSADASKERCAVWQL